MVFDVVRAGDTNRADTVHEYASGKAVNAARVLHTLGHDALYLGQVGGDRGRFFRRDLEQLGIAHDLIDVAADTRLCVTVVDRQGRQSTELIEEPTEIEPGVSRALLERFVSHLGGAPSAVILGGSLAPGVSDDFYAEAARLCREADVPVILDARGDPLRAALSNGPLVVKPNRAELAATAGRPVESRNAMHAAMAALVERGANWVVCTRGRDGSSVCGKTDGDLHFWEATAPRICPINAVGSGDAYAAGLAAGVAAGVALPDACRYASACGAANAETLLAGHVDADRISRLACDVQLREVA